MSFILNGLVSSSLAMSMTWTGAAVVVFLSCLLACVLGVYVDFTFFGSVFFPDSASAFLFLAGVTPSVYFVKSSALSGVLDVDRDPDRPLFLSSIYNKLQGGFSQQKYVKESVSNRLCFCFDCCTRHKSYVITRRVGWRASTASYGDVYFFKPDDSKQRQSVEAADS